MRLAIRECDITPTRPCWQGGYVQRTAYFNKVNDPITATVFVLSLNNSKVVWVAMDVAGVQKPLADKIISKTADRGVNLERKDIIFNASHTHSGPLVGAYNDRELDSDYIEEITDKLSSVIAEAWNDLGEEVEVYYSNTLIDGIYSNRNDKNKKSDKWVHMLGFFNENKLIGLYYSMAHHCTVLGPNFMDCSADLFGEIRRLLKLEFNVPVLMIQGNAGDMGNKQYRTSNTYDAVVKEVANLIDQINKKRSDWLKLNVENSFYHEHAYTAVYDVDVTVYEDKKKDFEKRLETESDFDTVKLLHSGINSFNRKIKQGSRHVEKEMPYRIYDMDDIQLVAVPGELGSILGLRIKSASKAKLCLVMGYVDPCDLGYMVEKEAYGGFSQESNVTDYPAGIPDEFVQHIIEHL